MKRSILITTAAAGIMTVGLVAGCGGDSASTPAATNTTTTATAMAAPMVSFSTPTDGAEVAGTFTAKVDISEFMLSADKVGMQAKDGEGHIHFSLDEGKFDQPKYSGANGELAKQLGTAGKYSPSVEPMITYAGIPAGRHTLKVWLANNDHSDTGYTSTVTFTVK